MRNIYAGLMFLLCTPSMSSSAADESTHSSPTRPNIVWISSEDHGPQMGCYGDSFATTPNVDALASRGLRYSHCWSNAPVCAPARTTIITGMYPTSIGAEHMRSMVSLPRGVRLFPSILRDNGYYCTNNSKEDYNVKATEVVWDDSSGKAHWRNRRTAAQPFFAVFNSTASHESAIRRFEGQPQHDPAQVRVPAYHPDTPIVRRDWAIYYDSVTKADAAAGQRLSELEEAGLAESTIVFYWGDHGSGMPRSKRWPCNSGLHVPLIVYIPQQFADLRPDEYESGGISDRLVSFVDFAPTMLSLVGIKPEPWMQGHAFLGKYTESAQSYLYGFRGRMDEREDLVRSVTDGRFVYLRNYMPHKSQAQHVAYQFETATTAEWRKLFEEGKLNDKQRQFWSTPKACEELYDLTTDQDEVDNLANQEGYQSKLTELREVLENKAVQIRDLGFVPEGRRFEVSGDLSQYDWARLPGAYECESAIKAADTASRVETIDASDLDSMLESSDSIVRYWGALGLLMRGNSAVETHGQWLRDAVRDDSPYIAITAARALATHGNSEDQPAAIEILLTHADWGSTKNVFITMLALDALNAIHEKLEPYAARVEMLPSTGKSPDQRYNSYVPRLIESTKAGLF